MQLVIILNVYRSPRKVGNPPPSPLIVNKRSTEQNTTSVFGFNAPVTTTYQTSTSNTATIASVTKHLELPEEPLAMNGMTNSSSNDSSCIPNGALHYNTPVNGNSKSASPEPIAMTNGMKRSPSPAIPAKSLYTHERISPPSNRPPHLRLS